MHGERLVNRRNDRGKGNEKAISNSKGEKEKGSLIREAVRSEINPGSLLKLFLATPVINTYPVSISLLRRNPAGERMREG